MRDAIKRILKEQVNDKFFSLISKKLDQKNSEFAHSLDMSEESWRLGSEILYKSAYKDPGSFWCIQWGSPEQEVLINQMAITSNIDDYLVKELRVYCDIINRYYDLTTPIPRDDNSILSLLGRKYYVTVLDGDPFDYSEHTGSEDGNILSIGYEYNDFDENYEVGEPENDVIWFLKTHFKLNTGHAKSILYQWTYDQINNGHFNG